MKPIVVFDICGTLYQSNTTFDFLSYYLKGNKLFCFYKKIYNTFIWRVFNKIMKNFFSCDITRILAIRFLKGIKKEDLHNEASDFVNIYLESRKNEGIYKKCLEYIQSKSVDVYLVSATLDFIAEEIAKSIDCKNVITTTIQYKNDVCEGKLMNDLLGNKIYYIKKRGIRLPIDVIYTDDLTDWELILSSNEKNIIIYPRTEKRWQLLLKKIPNTTVNLLKY